MELAFAGERIQVTVTAKTLRDADGHECAGLWVWREHRIYLSGVMPRERRPEIFRHEWCHMLHDLIGMPNDQEQQCNWFVTVSRDLERQLQAIGGEQTIMDLQPEPAAGKRARRAKDSKSVMLCGVPYRVQALANPKAGVWADPQQGILWVSGDLVGDRLQKILTHLEQEHRDELPQGPGESGPRAAAK